MAKTKAFLSAFLIALMIGGLAFVGTMPFGKAQSGTNVSYIISSDTTWSQANSPYNFTGNVLVNSGVTLTIGADATVNLNNYYLEDNGSLIIQPGANITMGLIGDGIDVNGVLSAVGTSSNPIYINGDVQGHIIIAFYSAITFSSSSTSWNQQTNSGSVIENTVISNVEFEISSSVRISDSSLLSGALTLTGGSPTIENNNIDTPLSVTGGSPVISNNQITGNLYIGAGSSVVADNTLFSLYLNDESGSTASTLIEFNLINDSLVGISVDFQNSDASAVTVENNTITNNAVGIQVESSIVPTIVDNNIYDNQLNAKLTLDATSEINLINNWWGTSDQQAINQTIYDYKDDFTVGTVNFVPFLTAPNPDALPNPNAPIPTPNASPSTATPTTTSNSTSIQSQNPPNKTAPTPVSTTTSSTTSPSASPLTLQSQKSNASAPQDLTVAAVAIAFIAVAVVAFFLGKRAERNSTRSINNQI